ncbi:MAG: alpha-2,3-sialyltransferase [Brevinema sp.]
MEVFIDIVIAGKGESLKNINYKRLPKTCDVYHINQFYFEEQYYLGNKLTYFMFNNSVF